MKALCSWEWDSLEDPRYSGHGAPLLPTPMARSLLRKVRAKVLAVSLGNWEFGNSWSREEPFLPGTVLRRLKTARRFELGNRLLQVTCQVSALALEMTEDALRTSQRIRGDRPRTTMF